MAPQVDGPVSGCFRLQAASMTEFDAVQRSTWSCSETVENSDVCDVNVF